MLRSKYRFSLDIKLTQSQVSIPVLLNDTVWGFYINLIDDGKPFFLPDGSRAVFVAKKPDGNTLFNDCIIEKNNIVRYDFTANTTNVEGTVPCEIRVYGPAERLLTCPRFTMVVNPRVLLDDEIVFSESEHTTIDSIIASEYARQQAEIERKAAEEERKAVASRAEEAVEKAEEAVKAAEEAVGKAEKVEDGHTPVITIQDGYWYVDGENTGQKAQGEQGLQGNTGKGFSISKIYVSVTEMNAGFSTDGVEVGDFVLINTDNVDDADNAKIYVKTDTGYSYLIDLSGAEGIQGPKGDTPIKGKDYFTEADKDALVEELLNRLPLAEEVSV